MTGPSYPHPDPAPDSNAIGNFVIGVGTIGDIPWFDPWVAVISQYANSPILTSLIESFNAAMDMTVPIQSFYDLIWNVQTAEGYGLDVWGRIVGIPRTLSVPGDATYLGYEEAVTWETFGHGVFYSGGGTTTNYLLSDTDFRRVILAKAATNICDGSIPATNQILLNLFPARGACYVTDGLDMSMTLTFNFALSAVDLAIVRSGAIPIPSGVAVTILEL